MTSDRRRSIRLHPVLSLSLLLGCAASAQAQTDEPALLPNEAAPNEGANGDPAPSEAVPESSPPDAVTESAEPDVRSILADAVAEYDAARYPEALALFQRAHGLAPTARTLRGIGMAAFESGLYVTALRALRASLDHTERPLTTEQRDHVLRLVARTEVYVATLDIETDPPGGGFLIDGSAPTLEPDGTVLVDAGRHSISPADARGPEESLNVDLVGGTTRRVTVRGRRGTESSDAQTLLIPAVMLLVAGGLATAAAASTGIVANELFGRLRSTCEGFVCPEAEIGTRDRAADLALATDIIGSAAAVTLAAGVVLLAASISATAPPPVSLACTTTGCGLDVRGAF